MKPIQYSFFRSSKELRQQAGEDLQHSWKGAVVVTTLSSIIPKILMLILSGLLFVSVYYWSWYTKWKAKNWLSEMYTFWQKVFKEDLKWLGGGGARTWLIIFLIAIYIVYIALRYGGEKYFLLSSKNEDQTKVSEVFSGFSNFFKVFAMQLQISWVTYVGIVALYFALSLHAKNGMSFLTSMLLIVAIVMNLLGFIHGNRTKMARRIEIENPEMDTDEVFELSVKYMDGRILSNIWLHITFIPYFLIGIFTLFIYDFKVSAQMQSADAFFYLDLK